MILRSPGAMNIRCTAKLRFRGRLTGARNWSFALHFHRSCLELRLTRRNEHEMYREIPFRGSLTSARNRSFALHFHRRNTVDSVDRAVAIFDSGLNCSQSVCAAYAEQFGLDRELALKVSAGFGGGMGRMAQTCGAVSGAFMVLGLKYGTTDPEDKAAKEHTYERVRAFADQFTARQGSLLCRELLDVDISTAEGLQYAREQKFFTERCPAFIKTAADILAEMLQED
ncbi:hypothetical protein U27_00634 [Candidatus Vecturithrix granuli]|uniref:C_GCAxxG_C_C family protein n=1 Tax=Vecturithrix granuli TaxID=1499967 RepID=A0A081C831_VECG1|nr:hypothetical protein U27_00634 [Candidatus Vecturithrix granuli]